MSVLAVLINVLADDFVLLGDKINPGYFPLAVPGRKPKQISMFLHISTRVWGGRWSPHTSEQKGSMLKLQ